MTIYQLLSQESLVTILTLSKKFMREWTKSSKWVSTLVVFTSIAAQDIMDLQVLKRQFSLQENAFKSDANMDMK